MGVGGDRGISRIDRGDRMVCASLIIGLHLVSYHFTQSEWYPQNNVNPGVYAECDGWTVGAYRNTLDRPSAYAGYTWHAGVFGLSVGAVSGYQRRAATGPHYCPHAWEHEHEYDSYRDQCVGWNGSNNSALAPMVAPHLTFGPARIWLLPKVRGTNSAVAHLSLQQEFR
jgi:hypothetical protein